MGIGSRSGGGGGGGDDGRGTEGGGADVKKEVVEEDEGSEVGNICIFVFVVLRFAAPRCAVVCRGLPCRVVPCCVVVKNARIPSLFGRMKASLA